jgi:hypothetical protein
VIAGFHEADPQIRLAEGAETGPPVLPGGIFFFMEFEGPAQKLGDFRGHLAESPVDTFNKNVMIGASCMSRREAEMRHEIGIGNMMWGTDFPHPEGTWPYTRKLMQETFHGLPEQDIEAILGGNALRFYGLDEEKLRIIADRIGPEKNLFREEAASA